MSAADASQARAEQKAGYTNAERAAEASAVDTSPPLDAHGQPMAKIIISAGELVGLKEFSNIVIGPARVEAWVSLNEPNPFTEKQLKNIASGLLQLGTVVEQDVVAELREIALNTIDPAKIPNS